MSNCKSCHAPVAWIKTERGKLMVINPGAVVIRSHIPGTDKTTIATPDGRILTGTRI